MPLGPSGKDLIIIGRYLSLDKAFSTIFVFVAKAISTLLPILLLFLPILLPLDEGFSTIFVAEATSTLLSTLLLLDKAFTTIFIFAAKAISTLLPILLLLDKAFAEELVVVGFINLVRCIGGNLRVVRL